MLLDLKKIMDLSKFSVEDLKYYLEKNFPEYTKCHGTAKRDLTNEEILNRDYYRGRFVNHIEKKQIFNWELN